jgi:preprotein translocase subunit SecG
MISFLIVLLSLSLTLISLFSVLIILMQRPSEDAGMGSALGGGAVTSIFGGEAGNILHRWTISSTILFFLLSLLLSLLYMAREGKKEVIMKLISAPESLAVSVPKSEEESPAAPADGDLIEEKEPEGVSNATLSPENFQFISSKEAIPSETQNDETILELEAEEEAAETGDLPDLSINPLHAKADEEDIFVDESYGMGAESSSGSFEEFLEEL